MNAAKPAVLAERRKAKALALYNQKMYSMRSTDLESASNVNLVAGPGGKYTPYMYNTASSTSTATLDKSQSSNNHLWPGKAHGSVDFNQPFNTSESAVNLPLSVKPKRWDAHGRAVIDNQPDFGDGSQQHRGGVDDQDRSRRPPPAGAKMPAMVQGGVQAQQYGGSTAAPDIRVIRASGASTNTNASVAPGQMPYARRSPPGFPQLRRRRGVHRRLQLDEVRLDHHLRACTRPVVRRWIAAKAVHSGLRESGERMILKLLSL